MMSRNYENIKKFNAGIGKALGTFFGKDFSVGYRIFRDWGNLVSKVVYKKTRPIYFKKGKLFILVRTVQWANEFTLNKSKFIENLNMKLGKDLIKDVVFQQGKLGDYTKSSVLREKVKRKYELTKEEEEEIKDSIQKYNEEFQDIAYMMYKFYYIQRKKK